MKIKLGKLKQLGMTELSDLALYMPTEFSDYRFPITNFDVTRLHSGCEYLFRCHLESDPSTKFSNGRPQTLFTVTDGSLLLQFTLFGDVRDLIEAIKEKDCFYIYGTLNTNGTGFYIINAEVVDDNFIGTVCAIYPGLPGKLKAATVRKLITEQINAAIPLAVESLRTLLYKRFQSSKELRSFLQCHKLTLTDVLNSVHKPTCIESALEALNVMQRIALISAADTLIEKAIAARVGRDGKPIIGWPIGKLLQNVPFSLTSEQLGIVDRQIHALQQGKLLNLLLIGDVGTGKTVVYGMIAGYVCSANRRICVVLPNGRLAEQIYEDFKSYFPEFTPLLINGESKYTYKQMQACSMLIGTSALLFREVGEFDLVVIDEQQKLSSAQRMQLVGSGTSVIEVSATPIPRTLALAQYGAVNIEFIKHCHVEKSIETIILERQHSDYMDSLVLDTVRSGYKALIVCPKRDSTTDNDIPDTEAVAAYYENMMPGQVSMAHSGLTDEENTKAISDIKEGITSVLVSTVIVEVGLTIPKLVLGIVMGAERFGLSQLHQIRGRLSRSGGYGLFCLYLHKVLKTQKSVDRMVALTEITCGHELALRDLKLRGVGDLEDGTTQHGAYHGHIRNLHVDIDELEETIVSFSN